jgi:hypothetical protein
MHMTEPLNPWRQAIDDALLNAGLDCLAPDADPRESIKRLIEWSETLALDPAISERAQMLAAPQALTDERIKLALQAPGCERLREWASIGPVQRAAVELFADRIAAGRAPGEMP